MSKKKVKFSTRICHGSENPYVNVGDKILPGTELLKIGNTGESTAVHHHTDSILGHLKKHWHVSDFISGKVSPAPEQTNYLLGEALDDGFYKDSLPHITAPFFSSEYLRIMNKNHYGTDSRPLNIDKNGTAVKSKGIAHWNRSFDAECVYSGFDKGYGWSLILCYEA